MYKLFKAIRTLRGLRRTMSLILVALVAVIGTQALSAADASNFVNTVQKYMETGEMEYTPPTEDDYDIFMADYERYQKVYPGISLFEFSVIYDTLTPQDYEVEVEEDDNNGAAWDVPEYNYDGLTEEERAQKKLEAEVEADIRRTNAQLELQAPWLGKDYEDADKNAYTGNDLRGRFTVAPIFYGDTTGEHGYYGYGVSMDVRFHGADKQYKYDKTRPATKSLTLGFDVTNGFGPVNNQIQTTIRLGYSAALVKGGFRHFSKNGTPGIGYKNYFQFDGSLISVRYNYTTKTIYVPLEFGFYWHNTFSNGKDPAIRLGVRVGFDLFEYNFETEESKAFPFNLSYGAYAGILF